MFTRLSHLMVLIILLLLAACQPQAEEVVELPTLAVLPSLTPSHTPTPTFTPTATLTFTPTLTPTNTPTATVTLTRTPTVTATFSVTPTFTLTFTPTFTATPTATNTPVATNTPNAPQILSFTTTATTALPNSSITLAWNSIADTARIDQLNQQGALMQTFSISPVGSLVVTVPANAGSLVVFRLAVQRAGQEVTLSLPIAIQCASAFFFGSVPQGAACPSGNSTTGIGAFQDYERGFMVYISANNQSIIYGAVDNGNRYVQFANSWDGVTSYSCFGTVPGGLVAPQGIFAWAYCNTAAPGGGSWVDGLGFATADGNIDNRTIQFDTAGGFYIDSPIGVFRFSGGSNLTWTKVQ